MLRASQSATNASDCSALQPLSCISARAVPSSRWSVCAPARALRRSAIVRYGSRCSSGGANRPELPASRMRSSVEPERGGDSTNTARSFFGVPSSPRSRAGKMRRKVASLPAVTRCSSGIEVTRVVPAAIAGWVGATGTPLLRRPATNSAIWRTLTSSMYLPPCISRSWKPSLVLNSLSMATAIWMKSIDAKPTSPTMVVSGVMPPSMSTSQSSVRSAMTPMTRCSTASTVYTLRSSPIAGRNPWRRGCGAPRNGIAGTDTP